MKRPRIDNYDFISLVDALAREKADGHFTIFAFTGNYRVMLGTPNSREDIENAPSGRTLQEALMNCVKQFAKEEADKCVN